MSLVLGVELKSKFYIGDTPVEVVEIKDHSTVTLRVNDIDYVITDKQAVEIYPRVFVSCGRPSEVQVQRYKALVDAANKKTLKRKELLDSGKLSLEDFDKLPPVEYPSQLFFRLLIDAPRYLVILRSELYERSKRQQQQRS